MLLTAGLLAMTAWCAPAWRDNFDAATLNARWQFHCPVAGPTLSLTDDPGWARITVPQRAQGYNHWTPGPTAEDAPMLITAAPAGDFAFESHLRVVSYGPNSNFHLAAVIGFSPGFVLAWGPFRAPSLANSPHGEPALWAEPTGWGGFLKVPGAARDLYLRIERRGNDYALLYRRSPAGAWTKAGDYHGFATPHYVGFMGKTFGDGKAAVFEVDYAAVEPLPSTSPTTSAAEAGARPGPHAELTVLPASPWPLNVGRYSHFIEHLGRCIYGGLWAEKLTNRKFTGAADGGVVESWRPIGADHATFAPDETDFYCPAQSQRIELRQKAKAGIAQGPMGFRGGVAQVGYIIAKSRPAGMELTVSLVAGDHVLVATSVGQTSADWRKLAFTLPALAKPAQAEVHIVATGKGTLWLGAVSLMPGDNLDGWRKDVVDALRVVRPPMIRWPGGNFASQYDWREGIGDRDRRPCRWNRAWNQWEWNDVGTDEFLRLCQLLGCQPYICANAGEGTPQEAAEWVQYCNGPADSPMGRLRAQNGHPAPYGVKFWGLGNEMYGSWQLGQLDGTKYGLKAAQMAYAMQAVDGPLETVLVGVDGNSWGDFTDKAVGIAGPWSDYVSEHHYTGINVNADDVANYAIAVSAPQGVESTLADDWKLIRAANGGKPIPIFFDEWNIARQENDNLPGPKGFYTLRDALFAGEIFNMLNRMGPKVPLACVTQSVNVLGLVRVNDTTVAPTPTYWVLKLFRDRPGTEGLTVQYRGTQVDMGSVALPALDTSATYDPATRRLSVFLINRDSDADATAAVRVPWAAGAALRGVSAVTAPSYLACNDYAHPDVVVEQKMPQLARQGGGGTVTVRVPAHSVVAVDLELTNPRLGR